MRRKGFIDLTTLLIVAVIALGAVFALGSVGKLPVVNPGVKYTLITPTPGEERESLQLNPIEFRKVAITPPTDANSCAKGNKFNEEPEIFVGSDPPPGGTVGAEGLIRVWISDGNGGSVSRGEKIDPVTGRVTTRGDVGASDGAGVNKIGNRYYLWEPALYLTGPLADPNQPGPYQGDAEESGTPSFPDIIKGEVEFEDDNSQSFLDIPPIESPAGFDLRTKRDHGRHTAQYVWEVGKLNLQPGFYRAQIVAHDGDGDLAISCTTIQI